MQFKFGIYIFLELYPVLLLMNFRGDCWRCLKIC